MNVYGICVPCGEGLVVCQVGETEVVRCVKMPRGELLDRLDAIFTSEDIQKLGCQDEDI